MSATVITYERGDKYVEHKFKEKIEEGGKKIEKDSTARGLIGKLTVGAHIFDTLERMEGFVNLAPGEYPWSSMYDSKTDLGTVVNPWLGKADKDSDKINLLLHHGQRASSFKGCIGPGKLKADGSMLEGSTQAMTKIWEQCGGGKDRTKAVVVTLKVVGAMPSYRNCTKFPS